MKNIFIILFVLGITRLSGQNNVISIIPQPVKIEQATGKFNLTKSSTITFNNSEAQKVAEILIKELNVPTGFGFTAKQGIKGKIQLNLNETPNQTIGNEGYTLESNNKGVIISANKTAGLYYGIQTLIQLLPKEIESKKTVARTWTVPAVKITDYPRFAWRGAMLDVSRHFFTKEEVKTFIDLISKTKCNTFHWHLTDDHGWRIEIKALPKLTQVGAWRVQRYGYFNERSEPKPGEPATYGGFYTQEEIKEVINYAKDRNVTIIPEIDVPGHSMAAIASYPELCCTKDTTVKVNPGSNHSETFADGTFRIWIDNTLNPSDEKVYEFLDKVFTEVAALFPGEYIHVGGDECYKGYWKDNTDCQALMKKMNYSNTEQLQSYFMNRLEVMLKAKGKKLLGWDEILQGGISPDATLMSWRGMQYGIEAAKMKHNVVMTPTSFCYLNFVQGERTIEPDIDAYLRAQKCYSFEPVAENVDAKYILGGEANLWTEQIQTFRHVEYMIFPRVWALSEVFWSPKEAINWNNFTKRMENNFERNDIAEINYSKAVYDAIIAPYKENGKLMLKLDTEISDIDIFYTIDGTMPDSYSNKYSKPVEMPDGPITLRVVTYRNGKPIGHLITLKRNELEKRVEKN